MRTYSTNKGSVLALGLIILTAITVVSITAMQRSGIQSRMVGNIQHTKEAFNIAKGELAEIYRFYATQASATEALSKPLNSFDISFKEEGDFEGTQVFHEVDPGHKSDDYSQSASSNGESPDYEQKSKIGVTSTIKHTGSLNTLVEGFSVGSFAEYGFIISAESSEPTGKTLSSQAMGIRYIAPAG